MFLCASVIRNNEFSANRSRRPRSGHSRGLEPLELDRASIARLFERLREEDHRAAVEAVSVNADERPKRSYDRRNRVERNRRSQSERINDGNEMELDCLLSSKNSNRSDRSRKSAGDRRSRSKQETAVEIDDADD